MIKVHFYDYGCGELDIEKELGITDEIEIGDFLIEKIPELGFEGNDSVADLDDNLILWYSADDEEKCVQKIQALLKSCISSQSRMQYTVKIVSGLI